MFKLIKGTSMLTALELVTNKELSDVYSILSDLRFFNKELWLNHVESYLRLMNSLLYTEEYPARADEVITETYKLFLQGEFKRHNRIVEDIDLNYYIDLTKQGAENLIHTLIIYNKIGKVKNYTIIKFDKDTLHLGID